MNEFNLGRAWTKGFGFFSGQAANHAIILIGVGIIAPFVLQFILMGGPMGTMNPTSMMSQMQMGALGGAGGMVGMMMVAMIVSYMLQLGSYFGSWRQGLDPAESLAGAIIFGLIAGLIYMLAFVAVGIVGGILVAMSPVVGALVLIVALLPLFAMIFSTIAAVVAVVLVLVTLFGLAVGGSMAPNMQFVGGGSILLVVMLLVAFLLLWLGARFCCTAPVMASRKSFNLIEAAGESWRLTSAAQWRIFMYLLLLGFVLMIAFFIVALVVGAGAMASGMQNGGVPQVGMGTAIVGLIFAIPFAYLAVLVPAGIYRELMPDEAAAAVFA